MDKLAVIMEDKIVQQMKNLTFHYFLNYMKIP